MLVMLSLIPPPPSPPPQLKTKLSKKIGPLRDHPDIKGISISNSDNKEEVLALANQHSEGW